MTTDVLDKLRVLREDLAETLRSDPRTLTMGALDKSIAEIGGVLATSGVIAHGSQIVPPAFHFTPEAVAALPATPANHTLDGGTLDQVRALRNEIAESIRKDTRYLTLASLDRSIAEIGALGAGRPVHSEAMGKPLGHEAATRAAPGPADEGDSSEDPEPAPPPAASDQPPGDRHVGTEPHSDPVDSADVHPLVEPHVGAPADVQVVPEDGPHVEAEHRYAADPEATLAADPANLPETFVEHAEPGAPEPIPPTAATVEPESTSPYQTGAAAHEAVEAALAAMGAGRAVDLMEAGDDAERHGATNEMPGGSSDEARPHPVEPDDTPYAEPLVPGEWRDAETAQTGRGSGYAPMEARPGVAQYGPALSVKFGRLPNTVDLRPLMRPVGDQNDIKSCVADAVASALECWSNRVTRQDQALSRLFVYYNARWRDGTQGDDDGSAIQPAMEGLAKFGACPEAVWPFDAHLTLKRPGADSYRDAAGQRVADMARVPLKLDAWKQALAEGRPIVFGIVLFSSFDECPERGGIVPMPPPEDLAHSAHGFHAMCAVGYCESEKVFIVRNCWGVDWCDRGYCYMPFAYVLNPKFNDGDCWVFTTKGMSQPPREMWSDATDPVTNGGRGVDTQIEPYAIGDYGNVAIDFYESIRLPYNDTAPDDYSAYAAAAAKGRFGELESFDVATYLAVAGALSGPYDDEPRS